MQPWLDLASDVLPGIVALRRAIHADPELGLKTPATLEKVRRALEGLPLEFRCGESTSGVVATLEGGRPGRTVLLRGDMDALPMQEETGLPYASHRPGAMHACGHDAHTAMLVGAAQMLAARREIISGKVVFMFQPGEEGGHGARHMLDEGLLDPLPDAAFALHVMPTLDHGVISGRAGPLLASADTFAIRVVGRGGHASMPHDALDPVPVACEIVTAIQSFVTRRFPVLDPVVATVAKIEAGTAVNVIAPVAEMLGTLRTLSASSREQALDGLKRLAEGIAAAHGARAEVEFRRGYPVTNCDARAVSLGQAVVQQLCGQQGWRTAAGPLMGAEDFSYVLERVPGAMFMLGVAPPGSDPGRREPLHSTRMHLDESAMACGSAVLAAVAERFLERGFPAPSGGN